MIVGNLIGKSKLLMLTDAEQSGWVYSEPLDQDIIYNTDSKEFVKYDGTAGLPVEIGTPITTWRYDVVAPTGTSYLTVPVVVDHTILIFMVDGVGYRIMDVPATEDNEVYFNSITGVFELRIDVTPAIQFTGQWISIIYNNEIPDIIV